MTAIGSYINWKILISFVMTIAVGALLAGGVVMAINVTQTSQQLDAARATTVDISTITVTHEGISVALNAEAGAADTTITPSATDATGVQRAQTVTAGDYVYRIMFESTAVDDDIPAGTISIRWTTNSVEQSASLTVNAAVVGASDKGGFTLLVPGDASDTPEDIQLVYGAS